MKRVRNKRHEMCVCNFIPKKMLANIKSKHRFPIEQRLNRYTSIEVRDYYAAYKKYTVMLEDTHQVDWEGYCTEAEGPHDGIGIIYGNRCPICRYHKVEFRPHKCRVVLARSSSYLGVLAVPYCHYTTAVNIQEDNDFIEEVRPRR
jgi:hypothetical protein